MIIEHREMDSAIEAMRLGASDYLTKPFGLAAVEASIHRTRRFIDLNRKIEKFELDNARRLARLNLDVEKLRECSDMMD